MILRTENLVKRYRSRTVVNHVSIQVGQGEIVGLLGPNGAGKTTTFYMTVGLVVPNEGRIYLDDQDITRYPVYRRAQAGIGYLAQEASIYRKLSVEDNILSVLELTNRTKQEQQARLEELIAEFRLEKVRTNAGNRLSGGERRRAEIARCLAIDPKFMGLLRSWLRMRSCVRSTWVRTSSCDVVLLILIRRRNSLQLLQK